MAKETEYQFTSSVASLSRSDDEGGKNIMKTWRFGEKIKIKSKGLAAKG